MDRGREQEPGAATPEQVPQSAMRGPVGFVAVLLFWPALFFTLLPGVLFGVSVALDIFGASPRVVRDWALGAGYALVLTMIAGPAALVCGIVALITAPSRRP